ncbi:MAG: hypothetical protein ACI9E1_002426, partial [Cryomorphaceae bacterium]
RDILKWSNHPFTGNQSIEIREEIFRAIIRPEKEILELSFFKLTSFLSTTPAPQR